MLVARRNVMMIADEHLGAIRRGAVRVLAVNGERGSGRTAVLHELFERARRSGIDVELISTPDTRLPPIDGRGGGAEDVRTADARTADVVAAIAPGAGTETTDGVGADVPPDLGDVVDRAVEHLRDQRRPRAVLIDDVDRRPPADIDVVERLVVALGAEHESTRHGLMIVLTAAKPLAPDIAGHYRTMRSLRSWYSTELAHLDESHIADLCVRAGVVPDPLGVVLPIARRSGGIAGQVALLVEQERRRPGAAAAFDGDFAELAVTTARARTADLAASAIDVAEVAALAVEPVGLELLVDVLGRDAAELAPVCEDLTGRGVLRAAARDTWTVADVAVANVVVSAIDQRRAVQLHADLAAHLDARARDRSPPAPALEMRRARHLLAAADLVAASDRLHAAERAGRTAMRHHDWPNAASFAEAALGLCAPGDPLRPELLSLAGTVHHWNADLGRAVERFEELIGDDATVEDGTSDNALRDNALRDNALRGSALRDDAVLQLARIRMTNDPASVVAPNRLDVARLTRLADEHGDRRTRCLALDLLSEVHAHAAHTHEALAFADRAVGESRPMDDARLLGRALIARGLAELTAMEPHRARATYRLVRRLAAPADWLIDCWATTRAGLAALLAGDLAAAARLASEASALAAGRRLLGDAGLARAVQAAVAVCQGDLRAAGRLLDEATHFARRSDYHVILHATEPIGLLRALLAADADEASSLLAGRPTTGALRRFGRPVSDAYLGGDDPDRPPEPPSVEPRSFLQLTRLFIHADRLATDELRRDPDDARLAWLALSDERIGGNELAFGWPASRRRLLADLLTVLDEHEAAMRAYETAMAELERIGAFPDLARAELGYARLNADNGATRVAIRCCTSAERHFNRLGMPIFEARAVSLRRQLGVRSQTSAERSRWGGNFAVILMTDLVGSSATADEDGDDVYYRRVLEHLDTARHHIRAPAGREVDTTGDGIIAWFRDVESCEASARAILDAHDADDPEHGRSGVRIALDAGDAYWRDGRPFGGLVNRTARVAGLAAPGSILTTADVRRSSPEPRAYEPAGTQAVKGMAQPLELYWYTPETTGR